MRFQAPTFRLAPRHGFEPRFTAPKAAVLPLDDRGKAQAGLFPVILTRLSPIPIAPPPAKVAPRSPPETASPSPVDAAPHKSPPDPCARSSTNSPKDSPACSKCDTPPASRPPLPDTALAAAAHAPI